MRVLFVIAARGGSKGVEKKNIKEIMGLPLIAYRIISARKCRYEHRIILSTDDIEIATIGKKFGVEVPFIRPSELATDSASSIDVVLHAMKWVIQDDNKEYDYVCLLEPSSPFASYIDLNNALELINDTGADTVLSMKETEVNSCFVNSLDEVGGLSLFYQKIQGMNCVRRQDQCKEYTMDGGIYLAKWTYFWKEKSFHSMNSMPYIMPREKSVEIDTILDYEFAKCIAEHGYVDMEEWNI